MATFLRDTRISNVTVDEGALTEIVSVFQRRAAALPTSPNEEKELSVVSAVIRFDGKGYRVFSSEDLLLYFRSAKAIDGVWVVFQTASAISSNNNVGSFMNLWIDGSDPDECNLRVSSDDSDWVDASFSALEELFSKLKNKSGWIRSQWFALLVQLFGVVAGFMISLWAAAIITPEIPVENAFLIVFLFVFLLFSNIWGFLDHQISNTVDRFFPNIEFHRPDKDRYRGLIQAVIAAIVGALVLYFFHALFRYVGNELSKLFTNAG